MASRASTDERASPTDIIVGVDHGDSWQFDRLDLDAYLARLGLTRRPPSRDFLDALHEAHARTFTFDNIDVLLGAAAARLLADPGFGMSLQRPIPLADGAAGDHGGWPYRVREVPEGSGPCLGAAAVARRRMGADAHHDEPTEHRELRNGELDAQLDELAVPFDRAGTGRPATGRRQAAPGQRRTLTARAITRAAVTSDTADSSIIASFVHRVIGIVSVGLNAVAFVNDT